MLSQSREYFKVSWYGLYQPLFIRNDGSIIAYRNKTIYLIKNSKIVKMCSFGQWKLTDAIHILNRMFRRDIRCGCCIDKNNYLFFLNKALYHLKINEKIVRKIYCVPQDESTPLNIVKGRHKYIVYWGEYGSNIDKHEVSIYGLQKTGTIDVVKKLKGKNVRHIHNIIPNEPEGFYIFCGDNEKDAGIYYVNDELQDEETIIAGTQKARAVVGFITRRGLLYATDSVNEQNYILLLQKTVDGWISKEICKINGSVIYGARCKKGFIISTTVESPEASSGGLRCLLSRKRGSGILSDEVDMIYINEDMEARIVYKANKDSMPYKLFQYGCFKFPEGLENIDDIIFYPVAVKGVSGKMGKLHL